MTEQACFPRRELGAAEGTGESVWETEPTARSCDAWEHALDFLLKCVNVWQGHAYGRNDAHRELFIEAKDFHCSLYPIVVTGVLMFSQAACRGS